MPAFIPFGGPYCNHIGSCRHPVNSFVYAAVTMHPNGTGPFNLLIFEHQPPYTNRPVLVRQWEQGHADSPGPFGFCALECLPDGSLWIGAAGGVVNPNQVVPAWRIEPGVCAPFTPGGQGPKGDKGDTGPQGPPGSPGTGGGGESGDSAFEAVRQALKNWLLK